MANGTLDVLGLLLGQSQQQQQQSLDPASFVQSLTGQQAVQPANVVPTVPTRGEFEPGPLTKGERGRLIGSAIADVISQFIAAKGGPQPRVNAVEQFAAARRERAEREFQDALREFEQSEQRRREGLEEVRFERVQGAREAEAAARAAEREADFTERARQFDVRTIQNRDISELNRKNQLEIAKLQSKKETSAVARLRQQKLDEVDAIIRREAGNIQESLKTKSPEQIRREFDLLLSTSGLTDGERREKELIFLKFIEPVLREAEQAPAPPPPIGMTPGPTFPVGQPILPTISGGLRQLGTAAGQAATGPPAATLLNLLTGR